MKEAGCVSGCGVCVSVYRAYCLIADVEAGRVPAVGISGRGPEHDVITSQTKEPQLSVTLCLCVNIISTGTVPYVW